MQFTVSLSAIIACDDIKLALPAVDLATFLVGWQADARKKKQPTNVDLVITQDNDAFELAIGDVKTTVMQGAYYDWASYASREQVSLGYFEMPENRLRDLLNLAAYCMGVNDHRPALNGVCLDPCNRTQ